MQSTSSSLDKIIVTKRLFCSVFLCCQFVYPGSIFAENSSHSEGIAFFDQALVPASKLDNRTEVRQQLIASVNSSANSQQAASSNSEPAHTQTVKEESRLPEARSSSTGSEHTTSAALGDPSTRESSVFTNRNLYIYGGIGLGAVALAAWGLSSSSDSSSSGGTTITPECVSIAGSWTGYLDLVGVEPEQISAVVKQTGGNIEITTTTSQAYGKKFVGVITNHCTALVYDQTTGEDWSTFTTTITAKNIELYDYVGKKLDHLHLVR